MPDFAHIGSRFFNTANIEYVEISHDGTIGHIRTTSGQECGPYRGDNLDTLKQLVGWVDPAATDPSPATPPAPTIAAPASQAAAPAVEESE